MQQTTYNNQGYGYLAAQPTAGLQTTTFNSSTPWGAFGFYVGYSANVTKFRIYVHTVTGSINLSDVSCDIYTDGGGGHPSSTSLGTVALGGATALGTGWIEFTFAGIAVTGGNQYYAVIKNNNATPASNNFSVRRATNTQHQLGQIFADGNRGIGLQFSTWNGSAWSFTSNGCGGYRVGFSDGTYSGFPVQNITSTTAVGKTIESGTQFIVPSGVALNVVGAGMAFGNGINGNLYFNLYSGSGASPTLMGSTSKITPGDATGSSKWGMFPSNLKLLPGTYLLTGADDNTTTETGFLSTNVITWDTDSNSAAMAPLGNVANLQWATGPVGGPFTYTAGQFAAFGLLLDPQTPYLSAGPIIIDD